MTRVLVVVPSFGVVFVVGRSDAVGAIVGDNVEGFVDVTHVSVPRCSSFQPGHGGIALAGTVADAR